MVANGAPERRRVGREGVSVPAPPAPDRRLADVAAGGGGGRGVTSMSSADAATQKHDQAQHHSENDHDGRPSFPTGRVRFGSTEGNTVCPRPEEWIR